MTQLTLSYYLNKCRACLKDVTDITTIQSLYESEPMGSLLTYFHIKIVDGLPKSICQQCVGMFSTILKFKNQCILSEITLQNVYNESQVIKSTVVEKDNIKKEDSILSELTLYDESLVVKSTVLEQDSIKKEEDSTNINAINFSDIEGSQFSKNNLEFTKKSVVNTLLGMPKQSRKKKTKKTKQKCIVKKEISNSPCNSFETNNIFKETEEVCTESKELEVKCEADSSSDQEEQIQSKCEPICDICNKKFSSRNYLRRHRQKHQANPPQFYCEICKKFYNTLSIYTHKKRHQLKLTREKIVCKVCGVSVFNMKQHLQNTHPNPNEKFTCSYCKKSFKSKRTLYSHTQVYHENPEKYKSLCPICGKTCAKQGDVDRHMIQAHGNEMKFQCRHCTKTFKLVTYRNIHEQMVHLKQKRYRCDICSQVYSTKVVLENHIRTHTGEKPFICELCSRPFSQSAALRTHLKLVHQVEKIKFNKTRFELNA